MNHPYLKKWLAESWTVGQYSLSEAFKSHENHSCVCKPDLGLIAVTGPADDRESQMQSDLFAAAPKMLQALREVLSVCDDSFQDAGTPGNHYTRHICPLCGGGSLCDEDCPTILVRAAIKKAGGIS